MIPKCAGIGVEELTKVKKITHDRSKTIYCIPKVVDVKEDAICFTLFSELDAIEFKQIKNKRDRNEVVKQIDPVSVTAMIFGVTIFSFFWQDAFVIELIFEQISSLNLATFRTKKGITYDNIYIR